MRLYLLGFLALTINVEQSLSAISHQRIKRSCKFLRCSKCCSVTETKSVSLPENVFPKNNIYMPSSLSVQSLYRTVQPVYSSKTAIYYPKLASLLTTKSGQELVHVPVGFDGYTAENSETTTVVSPCCRLVSQYRQCCACCTRPDCKQTCSSQDLICSLANFCTAVENTYNDQVYYRYPMLSKNVNLLQAYQTLVPVIYANKQIAALSGDAYDHLNKPTSEKTGLPTNILSALSLNPALNSVYTSCAIDPNCSAMTTNTYSKQNADDERVLLRNAQSPSSNEHRHNTFKSYQADSNDELVRKVLEALKQIKQPTSSPSERINDSKSIEISYIPLSMANTNDELIV